MLPSSLSAEIGSKGISPPPGVNVNSERTNLPSTSKMSTLTIGNGLERSSAIFPSLLDAL